MVFDLDAAIADARRELEKPREDLVTVAVGGQLVKVTVVAMRSDEWESLTAEHPMRSNATSDAMGYNASTLPGGYPGKFLRVNGDAISSEKWAELYGVLSVNDRTRIGASMFEVNVLAGVAELQRLGKAKAGELSASLVSSVSARADSSGGSPRKSRATTTRKVTSPAKA